jgi:hypothetical protein
MNALKADPRTVDLRSLAPHFYRLAVRILELFEEEEMAEILTDVRFFLFLLSIFLDRKPVSNVLLHHDIVARLLKSVPWKSQTTPIIQRQPWAMALSFYGV